MNTFSISLEIVVVAVAAVVTVVFVVGIRTIILEIVVCWVHSTGCFKSLSHYDTVYLNYWGYQNILYITWKLIFPSFYIGFYRCSMWAPRVTGHIHMVIQFLPSATKHSVVDGCQGFSYSSLQIIHFFGKGRYVHEAFHIPPEEEVTWREVWRPRWSSQEHAISLSGTSDPSVRQSGVQILRRSPDLTPHDFFFWGYVKGLVYVPPLPREVDDLKTRITEALATINNSMLGRIWQELNYHLNVSCNPRHSHWTPVKACIGTWKY